MTESNGQRCGECGGFFGDHGSCVTVGCSGADAPLTMAIDPDKHRARLEAQLIKTIALERKAATRVKRAVTLHQKHTKARRRLEARIGAAEVQRIIARLSGGKEKE
jgi:hypothetical protein